MPGPGVAVAVLVCVIVGVCVMGVLVSVTVGVEVGVLVGVRVFVGVGVLGAREMSAEALRMFKENNNNTANHNPAVLIGDGIFLFMKFLSFLGK